MRTLWRLVVLTLALAAGACEGDGGRAGGADIQGGAADTGATLADAPGEPDAGGAAPDAATDERPPLPPGPCTTYLEYPDRGGETKWRLTWTWDGDRVDHIDVDQDDDGVVDRTWTYTHDDLGRLVRQEGDEPPSYDSPRQVVEFSYQDEVSESLYDYDGDGETDMRIVWHFEDDRLVRIELGYSIGVYVETLLEWDEYGNQTRSRLDDPEGAPVRETRSTWRGPRQLLLSESDDGLDGTVDARVTVEWEGERRVRETMEHRWPEQAEISVDQVIEYDYDEAGREVRVVYTRNLPIVLHKSYECWDAPAGGQP